MAGFHNVHCVNCGEECMSEGMAVDIDKLMRIHLEKIAATSENPVYQEAGEILSEIRLGMYLTKLEMVSRGLLDEDGYLQITGADVLEFIADRYQVELEEEENDSEDTFDKLCIRMRLYKEVDQDNSAIRNCIVNLILFLKENLNVVLLECSCNFHVNHDDQGGEYISSLQVIFIDGEVKELFHMVCPNCRDPY